MQYVRGLEPGTPERTAHDALQVISRTPHITAYLLDTDPKAYAQVVNAASKLEFGKTVDEIAIDYRAQVARLLGETQ